MGENNKKKKKRGGAKRRMTAEQTLALKSVNEWVCLAQQSGNNNGDEDMGKGDDFLPETMRRAQVCEKVVFDLHSHSICSDGYLSPSALVEKAHQNGVSFLFFSSRNYLFFNIYIDLMLILQF